MTVLAMKMVPSMLKRLGICPIVRLSKLQRVAMIYHIDAHEKNVKMVALIIEFLSSCGPWIGNWCLLSEAKLVFRASVLKVSL